VRQTYQSTEFAVGEIGHLMDAKSNLKSSLLPISCAVIVAGMFMSYVHLAQGGPSVWTFDRIGFFLSPLVLIVSALFLARKSRIGFVLAAIGSALAILWVFGTESRAYRNSWIALNASGNDPVLLSYLGDSLWRIVSIAVSSTTLIWAGTRLFPSTWQIRKRPANQRMWPAIAVSLISILAWFILFVSPYRQPIIVDAVAQELGILHVQKDGLTFHETRVTIYHDSRFFLIRNDRKLLRYSFMERPYEGVLDDDLRAELKAVLGLPELKRTQDKSPRALMARKGEGWYTETSTFAITAFTTENGLSPPDQLVQFFRKLENSPSNKSGPEYVVRDVCLGFCYDPKAGLGYRAENQRCGYGLDRRERCY